MQIIQTVSSHSRRSLRILAVLTIIVGAATLSLHAQQGEERNVNAQTVLSSFLANPLFSSATAPANNLAYSSSVGVSEAAEAESFIPAPLENSTQPPPRRRYGRPRYNDSSHNSDGSNKYTFVGGVGLAIPTGNTHSYLTPSYSFQIGGGRNFNKKFATLVQFDWDNFGFQNSTLNNELTIYNNLGAGLSSLGGNSHVWSFTLDPVYSFYDSDKLGAYVTGGVGFYHKVATFTTPQLAAALTLFGVEEYVVNAAFDHYTSNAPGFNGGFGITYKPSRFANEKIFAEARYVFVNNSQRHGLTAANYNTVEPTYTGTDFYPANSNRTTYIPIKFGIRF